MAEAAAPVMYEDLAAIEDAFEEIDTEIIKNQYELSKGLYVKRAETVAKIDHFWALVFEQAPLEIAEVLQSEDSRIFAESLTGLDVSRPEIDTGSPRSFTIKFTFAPNDYFDDTTLEKHFWYRRARDDWTGLVSEPVTVHWKKGKDLTEGLTDAAAALWAARQKTGNMLGKGLPEYSRLKAKVEHWNGANTSFFTWFAWVSGRRWVSAEESDQANEQYRAKKHARARGETVADEEEEDDDDDDGNNNDDSDVEAHESGEELAISLADDLWPNAIKFFTQAQEMGDVSDVDFEDSDEDDLDQSDDEPIDIRSLVQGKGKAAPSGQADAGPPMKKQKK